MQSSAKRTTIYRFLTGPDDDSFCHRVSKALSEGWFLYGSPSLTFDPVKGRVISGQAITREIDGEYDPNKKLSEM